MLIIPPRMVIHHSCLIGDKQADTGFYGQGIATPALLPPPGERQPTLFELQGMQGGYVQKPILHIYAPPSYYIGQVRRTGAQKWRTVTGKRKSLSAAMIAAIKAMNEGDKRARVLLCSTCGYYGPVVAMEAAK